MSTRLGRLTRYVLLILVLSGFGYATVGRHIDRRADGTLEVHSDVLTFAKAGDDLLHGRDLYYGPDGGKTSYVYPPCYALFNVPLAFLPPLAVDIGWYVLTVALLYAVFVRACRLLTGDDFGRFRERTRWILVAASVALALRYVVRNAQDANINVLILFLILEGFYRMEQTGHDAWAGLIGLAGAIKVLPMLFVLYFVARRQWRALAYLLAACAAATISPALVIGPQKTWEALQAFFAYGSTQMTPAGLEVENFSVWGTLGRLFSANKAFDFPDGTPVYVNIASVSLPVIKAAVALADAGLAVLVVLAARADGKWYRGSLVLALLAMNLGSVLTEDHHTVGYAVAYFFLLILWNRGSLSRADRWLVVLSGLASTLLSYDLVVPLAGKLAYMTLLAYSLPVLPVGLLLTWLVWKNAPRASGIS